MFGYLPQKQVVFYNPGKSGVICVIPAKHYVTAKKLLETQELLVNETAKSVIYIEDRRKKSRRKQEYRLHPMIY